MGKARPLFVSAKAVSLAKAPGVGTSTITDCDDVAVRRTQMQVTGQMVVTHRYDDANRYTPVIQGANLKWSLAVRAVSRCRGSPL